MLFPVSGCYSKLTLLVPFKSPFCFLLDVFQLVCQMWPSLGHQRQRADHLLDFLADSQFGFFEALVAGVPPLVGAVFEAFVKA